MITGGFSPFPRKFGGSGTGTPRKNRLALIVDSLNTQMGSAYDTTQPSPVYARNMAIARVLDAAWSSNGRLGNQWQPSRMTDFLSRWEAIYGLYPAFGATDLARRANVAASAARTTQGATYQSVRDTLAAALGPVFVGITHSSSAVAYVDTPAGWPMGVHTDPGKDWLSTVAYVAVQVTQPAGMPDGVFYATAASVYSILDPIMPAWVTFDWYRTGPLGAGFWFQDPVNNDTMANLDSEAFDS